ncbi:protease complex subunit PrcB family protein [Flavobacterium sp.]|uniref:protease complex subunit PrcB family protein n=1 Tax=Flavobacterium sp. TaxID=239 RepID=UPI002BE08111|nr:protease complex subunit PrcB family protein [Flavobacterium sp.]HSD08642.1 protease complex subunit PrcB family protein [Flavobacterium sp.]
MKNLISILFVALSFYSCTDSLDNVDPNQDCGTVTNVAYESFNFCGQFKENPIKPTYYIINSNEDFQKVFTTCPTYDVVPLPDFTQKRLLALSSGPKPTGGYAIKIQSVIQNDCQILVEYYETEPGENEIDITVITYPTDYVVLPKSNKPILFSKVNKVADYAIVGNYYVDMSAIQCNGDCQQFFGIENQKVLKYLNVGDISSNFNKSTYKALSYRDDFAGFVAKVPSEIKDLKGQTKTFGTPDSHHQGGVYFEWSQAGVVTKIYLDNDNTTDQTPNIIAFKKVIKDKIAELQTKS